MRRDNVFNVLDKDFEFEHCIAGCLLQWPFLFYIVTPDDVCKMSPAGLRAYLNRELFGAVSEATRPRGFGPTPTRHCRRLWVWSTVTASLEFHFNSVLYMLRYHLLTRYVPARAAPDVRPRDDICATHAGDSERRVRGKRCGTPVSE